MQVTRIRKRLAVALLLIASASSIGASAQTPSGLARSAHNMVGKKLEDVKRFCRSKGGKLYKGQVGGDYGCKRGKTDVLYTFSRDGRIDGYILYIHSGARSVLDAFAWFRKKWDWDVCYESRHGNPCLEYNQNEAREAQAYKAYFYLEHMGRGEKSAFGKNLTHATKRYREACSGGDMVSCFNLGVSAEWGDGAAKDLEKAVGLYERSCPAVAWACNNLGVMYERGEGVPTELGRAAELYRQACDGGSAGGCANLGWVLATGRGVTKDVKRAAKLLGNIDFPGITGPAKVNAYNINRPQNLIHSFKHFYKEP